MPFRSAAMASAVPPNQPFKKRGSLQTPGPAGERPPRLATPAPPRTATPGLTDPQPPTPYLPTPIPPPHPRGGPDPGGGRDAAGEGEGVGVVMWVLWGVPVFGEGGVVALSWPPPWGWVG